MREEAITILVTDDDKEITLLLEKLLMKYGYNVLTAANGSQMFEVLSENKIDLLLLDVMMPGDDGLSLCRQLRQDNYFPIIMISAMGEDTDRIVGLEMGADDYVAKPFNPRELIARIKAVLRRNLKMNNSHHSSVQDGARTLAAVGGSGQSNAHQGKVSLSSISDRSNEQKTIEAKVSCSMSGSVSDQRNISMAVKRELVGSFDNEGTEQVISFAGWVLFPSNRNLISPDEVEVSLSSGEYDLLNAFLLNSQKILSRDRLLDITKHRSSGPYDRSIDIQVSRLRLKVEENSKKPKIIKTVRGGGYMFTPKVEVNKVRN